MDGLSISARLASFFGPNRGEGIACASDIRIAASARSVCRRQAVRASLARPVAAEVGHRLGSACGVGCWASVEDSIVVLGPPRSGKGLQLVVPLIVGAPGAVVTTSTRPDNLAITLQSRVKVGPVAVFDPQGLARGVPGRLRWSPLRGCQDPGTAMVRARALTAGAAAGTNESSFWQASAEQAVRCLLHAGALAGIGAGELYRWSLSPVLASQAVGVLSDDARAAAGWGTALNAILGADVKQRDSIWAMVGIAFAALADPQVLDAVSPAAHEEFDPGQFLLSKGSLYLLGTTAGSGTTTRLVAALVEDIAETARKLAAGSPNARLDPPLTLVLDEAANYRLPSLPSLMSEGGGSGISTIVVLQSLAQARAVWGEHEGQALWDAAIVKIVLGGGSSARDLEDLSRLVGTRRDTQRTVSRGAEGKKSWNTSGRDIAILEPASLRQLPFGSALLLLRSAKPIMLTLQAWTKRKDSRELRAGQVEIESMIRAGHGR